MFTGIGRHLIAVTPGAMAITTDAASMTGTVILATGLMTIGGMVAISRTTFPTSGLADKGGNMHTLVLDIESIPTQRAGALAEFKANVKAPGNMSKPETIAAWMRDNAEQSATDAWRKTALDGSQGEILCIGFAIDGNKPGHVIRRVDQSERDLLSAFYTQMELLELNNMTQIVGHNVKDFDLRFLYQRSVIHGVRPSFPLRQGQRYGGDFVFDTMTEWAGWGNRISLKNLCRALDIPVKQGDIDGANLWDAVLAGRYAEIADYCMSDVEATRAAWRKMTFQGVPI